MSTISKHYVLTNGIVTFLFWRMDWMKMQIHSVSGSRWSLWKSRNTVVTPLHKAVLFLSTLFYKASYRGKMKKKKKKKAIETFLKTVSIQILFICMYPRIMRMVYLNVRMVSFVWFAGINSVKIIRTHTHLSASSTWACLPAYSCAVRVSSLVMTSWLMSMRLHRRSEITSLAWATAPSGSLKHKTHYYSCELMCMLVYERYCHQNINKKGFY